MHYSTALVLSEDDLYGFLAKKYSRGQARRPIPAVFPLMRPAARGAGVSVRALSARGGEQLLADTAHDFEIIGQLRVGHLALVQRLGDMNFLRRFY